MKVTKKIPTQGFVPFDVVLRIETDDELKALRCMASHDVSIPDNCVGPGTSHEHYKVVQNFLMALNTELWK